MEDFRKTLFDFITEHTQDGNEEAMASVLNKHFNKRHEDSFDRETFTKDIDLIASMLKPDAAAEFRKMINPFGETEESGDQREILNVLRQPNKLKWKDDYSKSSPDEIRAAFECSDKAHEMKCDCWNTNCVFFGDCRKCIVFHLSLKQFPTCQRSLLGDLEEHYILFSRDK